ncbi:unnamed protein product [Brassicogethes aeneus]|uniref:MICOS complex subunit MIC19 n=1 Tax=Brassicogethes aeneus TaxID=1431903 RepID=A0A9P0F9Y5_BRAAE|nr:unnamed protein product [Brassicogethes aeneus]
MGGNPSKTRKLSVENDDPTNVIRVSEDVVGRIKGGQSAREQPAPAQNTWGNVPQAAPAPLYLHEPSITTIQLRQENVESLKKNDQYWAERIKKMEANHQKINKVLDDEYGKALKELDGNQTARKIISELPCLDAKNAVLKCYKENDKEPMNCSQVVKDFQECVDKKRICMVAKQKG